MRLKSLRSNLVLLAVSIAFSLILGFILLVGFELLSSYHHFGPSSLEGVHFPVTGFDSYLGWDGMPNQSFQFFEKNVTTNSLGFRGEEVDYSKEHILVLGDSVAWGFGVDDTETIPYDLNKLTEKKYPNLQVLNLALTGYGIDQYYLKLEKDISLARPKLIIMIIFTGNDFFETAADTSYGKSKPFFAIRDGRLLNLNPRISRYSCSNLLSSSNIINKIGRGSLLRKFICGNRRSTTQETEEVIRRLFSEMQNIAVAHNSSLLFVISPDKQDYISETSELLFFRSALKDGGYNYLDYYEILKKKDINTSELYIANYTDHYVAAGCKLLAEAIYQYADEKGLMS